jgi:hypothetical protein
MLVHSEGTVTTMKSPLIRVFVGDRDRVKVVGTFNRAELVPLSIIEREAVVIKLVREFAGGVRVKLLIRKTPLLDW